jgi:ATP-binding cassette subfamily C protein CydD
VTQIADVSEKYRQATLNVLRITFLSALTLELLATISTAVVAVEIGLRLLYGRIEFQQAFFILLLAPEFYQPLRMLGARFHAGMNGVAAAERIYAVLDRPEPLSVTISKGAPVLEKPVTSFDLAFHKVSFSYPDRDRDALKEVSLTLASGRSYGLIGRSGAGKSTLMQLLLRFLVPAQGQITLNGVDIASIPLKEWRSRVSWVPQKPALLNASILENIRIAKPDATMDEIRLASSMARLDGFVMSMPEGYETVIYEQGGRVSSGEAQRIALARAFLKNAPLILMDEPTAHLDIDLEAELKEAVAQLMQDRMSLIIAHRLSTIKNVDALFLLEQGELIAQGTHEELLGSSSLYQQMVRQAKGER